MVSDPNPPYFSSLCNFASRRVPRRTLGAGMRRVSRSGSRSRRRSTRRRQSRHSSSAVRASSARRAIATRRR
eukprot:5017696-Prymnesium_polylepis.1